MNKIKVLFVFLSLIIACTSVEAQTKKGTRRTKSKTISVQNSKESTITDTVKVDRPRETPKYKSLNDPTVVRYLRGGFAKDGKIHLITNADYAALSKEQKENIMNKVAKEFTGYDIKIYSGGQQRELWIANGNEVKYVDQWNNDSLQIENYLPLELKRNGETKVFYYVGGTYNGGESYSSGSLNLRAGTYLYKNLLDASLTLNIGYSDMSGKSETTGDLGVDSRVYLPFRIKNVNLAPYLGAGISYSFTPETYFEFRALAGGCWFIGPGSLDFGVQYGTKSDFSFTMGYTFRIPVKKKQRK